MSKQAEYNSTMTEELHDIMYMNYTTLHNKFVSMSCVYGGHFGMGTPHPPEQKSIYRLPNQKPT